MARVRWRAHALILLAASVSSCITRDGFRQQLAVLGSPTDGLEFHCELPHGTELRIQPPRTGLEATLQFAHQLETQHEWYRLVTELLRGAAVAGDEDTSHCLRFLAAEVYFRQEQWADAINLYTRLIAAGPKEPLASWVELKQHVAIALLAQRTTARHEANGSPDPPASEFFAAARAYTTVVEAVIDIDSARAQSSWARFKQLAAGPAFRVPDAAAVLAAIDHIPRRRRWLAGLLSALLPGAGHVYCDQAQSGLLAATFTGIGATGSVEFFLQDLVAPGVGFALVGLTFYAGNVTSAMDAADAFNQAVDEDYRSFALRFLFEPCAFASWRLDGPHGELAWETVHPFHH